MNWPEGTGTPRSRVVDARGRLVDPRPEAHGSGGITHGARALLRRVTDGSLNMRLGPGRAIFEIQKRLARDLGVARYKDLPAPQRVLVRRIAVKEVVLGMIEAYALERAVRDGGIARQDGRLLGPLDERYLAWCNSQRLDLLALGLDRKPRHDDPFAALFNGTSPRDASTSRRAGQPPEAGPVSTSRPDEHERGRRTSAEEPAS